ncbi:interleukin-5 receptor subunit alpha [Saccopteryx bilineata]|uniref:interleukin-5 receptor subunit alpha n=1 Tax=Saccopteryx bilineata TaxID=59482 RepID=UPI0033903468
MAPTLLILWGTTMILQADSLPEKQFSLLPPVNFTIQVTGLAQVLLRWEPNPDQEPTDVKLGYHVKISAPEDDDCETRNTESKRVTILHKGFSASVRTIPWTDRSLPASGWVSAELPAPAGSPGTSIVNLTCTTHTAANNRTDPRPYRVSLRCTWLAGEAAPGRTQYFLFYRYNSQTEECREYSQDALQRNTGCWFPRTFIDSKGRDPLVVHVNGSSAHALIRPYDQLFALHAIDLVNPPGSVTATMEGTRLSLRWEKPMSAFPAHCFDYEVRIHDTRKGYSQTGKMTTNGFNTTVSDASRYSIEVRASVSSVCRPAGLWSAWSRPVYVGREEQRSWTEWFLIVLMAVVCFLFTCLFVCRTCHLWTKLFPPVPAPKSSVKDLIAAVNYEKAGSGETGSELVSIVEELGTEALEDPVF